MSLPFESRIVPAVPEPTHPMFVKTIQQAKRLIRIVLGFTVLLAGVIMLVTPGPGIAVIVGGLAILAVEFAWARWLLKKLKERGVQIRDAVFPSDKSKKPPDAPPDERK